MEKQMPRVLSCAKDVNDRLGEKAREKGSLGHSLLPVRSPTFGEHSKGVRRSRVAPGPGPQGSDPPPPRLRARPRPAAPALQTAPRARGSQPPGPTLRPLLPLSALGNSPEAPGQSTLRVPTEY
ncbi:hypothetical protein CapIbe_005326 [Capra ibex]